MVTIIKEYTKKEAIESGIKEFYFNVYGYDTYYTTEPTFATPTGNLKEFPRKVKANKL
jgi:hypothetical protein